MKVNGIVTFTTDFGPRDSYAGTMKGMVLSANPEARLVDITHEIPAHNIVNAAFTLARTCRYFPRGTIHVAVVDPGVGGQQKDIAILTDNYIFVGPDNGIFALVLSQEKPLEIRVIENAPFILSKISDTFHGRDVFAPCAGYLSAGRSFSEVGYTLGRIQQLEYPRIKYEGNVLKGEVVSIDSFGNMITNIHRDSFRSFSGKQKVNIYFGGERFTEISDRYLDVPQGSPLVLFGSSGHMEISMNGRSAAAYFMAALGSPVIIRKS